MRSVPRMRFTGSEGWEGFSKYSPSFSRASSCICFERRLNSRSKVRVRYSSRGKALLQLGGAPERPGDAPGLDVLLGLALAGLPLAGPEPRLVGVDQFLRQHHNRPISLLHFDEVALLEAKRLPDLFWNRDLKIARDSP